MRILIGLIALALCGLVAFAQENPAAGTWKLNVEKSTLNGPLPTLVHDGIMKIDREIFTGTNPAPRQRQARTQPVFKFDFSSDGRVLTLTRPGSDPRLKLVFDRQ